MRVLAICMKCDALSNLIFCPPFAFPNFGASSLANAWSLSMTEQSKMPRSNGVPSSDALHKITATITIIKDTLYRCISTMATS